MAEIVPVHFVAYEDSADLDINNDGEPTVENHDELINKGETYDEIRGMERKEAENYNLDIVEPCDALWDDRFEDIEQGDAWRLSDL